MNEINVFQIISSFIYLVGAILPLVFKNFEDHGKIFRKSLLVNKKILSLIRETKLNIRQIINIFVFVSTFVTIDVVFSLVISIIIAKIFNLPALWILIFFSFFIYFPLIYMYNTLQDEIVKEKWKNVKHKKIPSAVVIMNNGNKITGKLLDFFDLGLLRLKKGSEIIYIKWQNIDVIRLL